MHKLYSQRRHAQVRKCTCCARAKTNTSVHPHVRARAHIHTHTPQLTILIYNVYALLSFLSPSFSSMILFYYTFSLISHQTHTHTRYRAHHHTHTHARMQKRSCVCNKINRRIKYCSNF